MKGVPKIFDFLPHLQLSNLIQFLLEIFVHNKRLTDFFIHRTKAGQQALCRLNIYGCSRFDFKYYTKKFIEIQHPDIFFIVLDKEMLNEAHVSISVSCPEIDEEVYREISKLWNYRIEFLLNNIKMKKITMEIS